MKSIRLVAACLAVTLLLGLLTCLRVAAGDSAEQAPLITPNTIRIQSLEEPTKGEWVVMSGFSELGSPTFSHDGQWIAFDAYKDGFDNSSAERWIARRDGRDLKRLTFGATPKFSPDDKRLLFVRERVNDASRQEGIYIINQDGSDEKRIGPGRWPDWSPDGKRIVFSLGGEETGGARVDAKICIANADGSGREELTEGDCPSWSPDGKKIAYCYCNRGRLPIIRVFDIRENAVADLGTGWYRANWMPDSKSVVSNGLNGRSRVMVRMSLTFPRKVIEQPSDYERPFSPSLSCDGKEILFIARKPTQPSH
jgi:Tol biopolymer transport system component